jgi:hypothetical protein
MTTKGDWTGRHRKMWGEGERKSAGPVRTGLPTRSLQRWGGTNSGERTPRCRLVTLGRSNRRRSIHRGAALCCSHRLARSQATPTLLLLSHRWRPAEAGAAGRKAQNQAAGAPCTCRAARRRAGSYAGRHRLLRRRWRAEKEEGEFVRETQRGEGAGLEWGGAIWWIRPDFPPLSVTADETNQSHRMTQWHVEPEEQRTYMQSQRECSNYVCTTNRAKDGGRLPG